MHKKTHRDLLNYFNKVAETYASELQVPLEDDYRDLEYPSVRFYSRERGLEVKTYCEGFRHEVNFHVYTPEWRISVSIYPYEGREISGTFCGTAGMGFLNTIIDDLKIFLNDASN